MPGPPTSSNAKPFSYDFVQLPGGTPLASRTGQMASRTQPGFLSTLSQSPSSNLTGVSLSEYGARVVLEDIKDSIFVKAKNLSGHSYAVPGDVSGVFGFVRGVDRGTKQVMVRGLQASPDDASTARVSVDVVSGATPSTHQSLVLTYNGRNTTEWERRRRLDTQLEGGTIEQSSSFPAATAWDLRHGAHLGKSIPDSYLDYDTDGEVATYYANGPTSDSCNIRLYTGGDSSCPATSGCALAIAKIVVRVGRDQAWRVGGQRVYVVATETDWTHPEVLGWFETVTAADIAVAGECVPFHAVGDLYRFGYSWHDGSVSIALSASDLAVHRSAGNNLNAIDPQGRFEGGFEVRVWYDRLCAGESDPAPVAGAAYALPDSRNYLVDAVPLSAFVFPPWAGRATPDVSLVSPFRSQPISITPSSTGYRLSGWVTDQHVSAGCMEWVVDDVTTMSSIMTGAFVTDALSSNALYHAGCAPSATVSAVMASGLRRYWRSKNGGTILAPRSVVSGTERLSYTHPFCGYPVSKQSAPCEYFTSGWIDPNNDNERNRILFYNWGVLGPVDSNGCSGVVPSLVPLTAVPFSGYQWCGFWEVEDVSGYRQGYQQMEDPVDTTNSLEGSDPLISIRPPEQYEREDYDGRLSGVGQPIHWRTIWNNAYSTAAGPSSVFCVQPFDLAGYTSVSTWFRWSPDVSGDCSRDRGFLFGGAGQREVGYWNGEMVTRLANMPKTAPNPWKKDRQQTVFPTSNPNVGWTGSEFWIAGGATGDGNVHNTFMFNPDTSSWEVGPLMLGGKAGDVTRGACATMWHHDDVAGSLTGRCWYYPVVLGGFDEDGFTRNLTYFDASIQSIVFQPRFLTHPLGRTRAADLCGDMYVMGGMGHSSWGSTMSRMVVNDAAVPVPGAQVVGADVGSNFPFTTPNPSYVFSTLGDLNYSIDGCACGASSEGVVFEFKKYASLPTDPLTTTPPDPYSGPSGVLSAEMPHMVAAWKFDPGQALRDCVGQNNLTYKGRKRRKTEANFLSGDVDVVPGVSGSEFTPADERQAGYESYYINGGALALSGKETLYAFDDAALNPKQGLVISVWVKPTPPSEIGRRETERCVVFKGASAGSFAYGLSLVYPKFATTSSAKVKFTAKMVREDKRMQKTYVIQTGLASKKKRDQESVINAGCVVPPNQWTHVMAVMAPRSELCDNECVDYGYMGIYVNGVLQKIEDRSGKNSACNTKYCAYVLDAPKGKAFAIEYNTCVLYDLYDYDKTDTTSSDPDNKRVGGGSINYYLNDERGKFWVGSRANSRKFDGCIDELYIWGDVTFDGTGMAPDSDDFTSSVNPTRFAGALAPTPINATASLFNGLPGGDTGTFHDNFLSGEVSGMAQSLGPTRDFGTLWTKTLASADCAVTRYPTAPAKYTFLRQFMKKGAIPPTASLQLTIKAGSQTYNTEYTISNAPAGYEAYNGAYPYDSVDEGKCLYKKPADPGNPDPEYQKDHYIFFSGAQWGISDGAVTCWVNDTLVDNTNRNERIDAPTSDWYTVIPGITVPTVAGSATATRGGMKVLRASIGEALTTSATPKMAASPFMLTFNDGADDGCAIAAGGTATTDVVTFSIDPEKAYVVALDLDADASQASPGLYSTQMVGYESNTGFNAFSAYDSTASSDYDATHAAPDDFSPLTANRVYAVTAVNGVTVSPLAAFLFETESKDVDPSIYSFCAKGKKTSAGSGGYLPRNRYVAVKFDNHEPTVGGNPMWTASAYDVPPNCRHLLDAAKGWARPTAAYIDQKIVLVGHQFRDGHNIVTTISCVDDNGGVIPEIDRVFTTVDISSDYRLNANGKYAKANYVVFG